MSVLPQVDSEAIEHLREAGYVIVPLKPTKDMVNVGAPSCFNVPDGSWQTALKDAEECYRAMIEVGCL